MSICAKITNNIRKTASYTTASISKVANLAYRFGTSILGRKTLLAIRENIAEFAAYYVGAELAAPYGRNMGAKIGKVAGSVAAVGIAYFPSIAAAKLSSSLTTNLRPQLQQLIYAATFLGANYYIGTSIADPFTSNGVIAGEILGEYFAYYTSGIVCAFLAIKLTGSEEIFWGHPDKIRTYPVKTVMSMIGTLSINAACPILQNRLTQPVTDLALGSLVYNSLDLIETYSSLRAGRFLDGLLVKQLPLPSSFGFVAKLGSDRFIDQFVRRFASLMAAHLPPFAHSHLGDLVSTAKQHLKQQRDTHVDFNAPLFDDAKKLSQKATSAILVRGMNLYFTMLARHPECLPSRGNIEHFIERGNEILSSLDPKLCIEQRYGIDTKDPLFLAAEEISGMRLPEFRNRLSTFRVLTLISPANQKIFTDQIVELIKHQEREICGFELTGERQRQKIENVIENHSDNIVKCTLLCAPSVVIPLTDNEIRQFYIHLSQTFPFYYDEWPGKWITNFAVDAFKHQATHSQF